jgi:drug/metabolite transporter (DMT)-like permease
MGLWAIFAIGAYFLLAVNGVADKFLLTKAVKHPIAYAFYVGITGPLTFLLAVFGIIGNYFHIGFLSNEFTLLFLTPGQTLVAIIGGICFPFALYFSYKAIQQTSISRIMPIQGGLVPVFTLTLAYFILGERLDEKHFIAFAFLVLGAVLISFKKKRGQWHAIAFGNAVISSFLFAASLTLEKYAFNHSNFSSGLIWTRLGFFVASVSFLAFPKSREYIFNAPKETTAGNKFVYLAARVTGGASGYLQNFAIRIGSVTMVNALQGTQYMFILLFTSVLSVKFPKILKEDVSSQKIVQKLISVVLIGIGLYLMAM